MSADFYLTQVVSHHDRGIVERFLAEADRHRLDLPGVFGVFYYQSANRRTLDMLARFLPLPRDALIREFEAGASPVEICARTVRALGAPRVYISNLPVGRVPAVLRRITELAAHP